MQTEGRGTDQTSRLQAAKARDVATDYTGKISTKKHSTVSLCHVGGIKMKTMMEEWHILEKDLALKSTAIHLIKQN